MLSLVLPTYNEAQNLPSLIDQLDGVLHAIPHEIIIVDDNSPDGTWRVAQNLAERFPALRVIRRRGKKGLSSAVVDGFDAAHGDFFAVMDADGQHDSALLLQLLHALESGADLAIGSRYAPGGSVGDWVTDRRIISKLGTFFATHLSHVRTSDPLGGFFMIRATVFESVRQKIHPSGFKILVEILAFISPATRVVEVPLIFRSRLHGESKLSFSVHLAFCIQVMRLFMIRFSRIAYRCGTYALGVVSLLMFVTLFPRAWALRALYVDTDLRVTVQTALHDMAAHEGWLLSDITLVSLSLDRVQFTHRSHLRVPAPTKHCELHLRPTSLLTCTDA